MVLTFEMKMLNTNAYGRSDRFAVLEREENQMLHHLYLNLTERVEE